MKIIITIACITMFFLSFTHAQNPCVPTFSGDNAFIDNFAFHTLVNTYSNVDADQYVAYPDTLFTTTVSIGKTYPITISTDSPSGIYGKFGAWIDYNNDAFFDNTELIHYDSITKYTTSGLVTIPNNNNFTGLRRLRIIYAWYPPTITPCGSYNEGECEDYLINIVSNQPDTQTYCMPFNPEDKDNFIINNFRLDALINYSSGSNNTNYAFYTHSLYSANLMLNNTYEVFISKGASAGNTGGYAIWIDLNDDGEFSNAERIFHAGPNLTSITGTIMISNDTSIIGSHRMRVRSSWGDVPTDPCGLNRSGETEDYIVNILGPTTSIESTSAEHPELKIFPNPSDGNFYLEANVNNGELEIYTSLGERIFSEHLSHISTKEINLRNIPSGIYIVKLFDGEKHHVRQFIVD